MKLNVVGINFKSSPIELRETFSLSPTRTGHVIQELKRILPDREILLLSTCNRTELYVLSPADSITHDRLLQCLADAAKCEIHEADQSHFYSLSDREALEHLVAVSSSLDSMVVGETEILGQVKQAYVSATENQEDCKQLHKLCHGIFRAAKRVHAETDISRGRVSVSSIAVDFARKVFENLSSKNVMIIGAGETAELTLKSLVDKGVRDVFVLNRSIDKAEAIAREHGGKALPFSQVNESLCHADIVISCTGAPHCVVKTDAVRRAVSARHSRPILLIDIAMPRDIEEDCGKLENVYLYDIDDLQQVAEANLARRQAAIDAAWKIVREETGQLAVLLNEASFDDIMKQLSAYEAQVIDTELSSALGKESLAGLSQEAREEIRASVTRAVRRVLGAPRRALNESRKNGRAEQITAVVAELFGDTGQDRDHG